MIHPKALVEDSQIGAGTKVWQFASVIRNAHLGEGCNVASGATIDGAWCGDRCIIGHNVLLSPGAMIGNDVFVGPGAKICNDRWPSTSKDGFDIDLLMSDYISVHIHDWASIGANAVILPGVTIGKMAMVAAGTTASKSVPSDHVLMRNGDIIRIKPEWRERRMRSAA